MNTSTLQPRQAVPADPDLAEQARPGHGVPSQDPNPAAQVALTPAEAEREGKSVMMGGGMVGGAAIGAGIGVAVGGPVGVVVGGTLGAIAGALGGAAAGSMGSPEPSAAASAAPAEPVPRRHSTTPC
jgi:hypothetical protein